jgi:hypothetical protein
MAIGPISYYLLDIYAEKHRMLILCNMPFGSLGPWPRGEKKPPPMLRKAGHSDYKA